MLTGRLKLGTGRVSQCVVISRLHLGEPPAVGVDVGVEIGVVLRQKRMRPTRRPDEGDAPWRVTESLNNALAEFEGDARRRGRGIGRRRRLREQMRTSPLLRTLRQPLVRGDGAYRELLGFHESRSAGIEGCGAAQNR